MKNSKKKFTTYFTLYHILLQFAISILHLHFTKKCDVWNEAEWVWRLNIDYLYQAQQNKLGLMGPKITTLLLGSLNMPFMMVLKWS